jgi:hypothetical protein
MKTLNKLEQFQKEDTGFEFIKSYPILNKVFSKHSEVKLIELILSYQDNDKEFYMGYGNIGEILSLKTQSVKDIVCRLNKRGIITSTNSKNYNGINGGSSSTLYVNLDVIINLIKDNVKLSEEKAPSQPVEVITIEDEETKAVVVIPYVESEYTLINKLIHIATISDLSQSGINYLIDSINNNVEGYMSEEELEESIKSLHSLYASTSEENNEIMK